jgi:hypothetical protein
VDATGSGEPPEREQPESPEGTQPPPDPNPSAPNPSAPWAQPPPSQPPAAPPPGPIPPPPGAVPPSGTGAQYPPPAPSWTPAATGYAPRRTNSTAIVSLVFGIAQFVVCPFIGAIVAIVTGHVAQSQIKRSDGTESGSGMARAGTILGYVGLVLTILGIIGLAITFGVFGDDIDRAQLRSDAREFVDRAQREALTTGAPVRDPQGLARAYVDMDFNDSGNTIRLADGSSVIGATQADWERNNWRVQLHGTLFREADVCVEVPQTVSESPLIENGKCGVS